MTTRDIVTKITEKYPEDTILLMITEQMHEYIDEDETEEYGGLYDAYSELGRGEAESDIIREVIGEIDPDLAVDQYCEVSDTLCEIWGISTN